MIRLSLALLALCMAEPALSQQPPPSTPSPPLTRQACAEICVRGEKPGLPADQQGLYLQCFIAQHCGGKPGGVVAKETPLSRPDSILEILRRATGVDGRV